MSRPRRPFGGQERIEVSGDPWLTQQVPGRLGTRQRARWDSSTHWTYRQGNSAFDPLTFLHVLDAVANMDPDIELRAKALALYLNRERARFSWDPVTVGRVLSDLCDAFEDVLGRKMGILERGKDYRGFFYLLHHNPTTADLFYRVREDLMKLVKIEMDAQTNRQHMARPASPLLECPSLRAEWNDAEVARVREWISV